jgi:HIV Tat-specific factor 1
MDEIAERFGKCGVLMEDDDGDPRIKLYADDHGNFNGEALVVFFKEDSVILAENLLDDAELRVGDSSSRMRVQKAEFGHKGGTVGAENGESQKRVVDKKKATRRIVKMQKCVDN